MDLVVARATAFVLDHLHSSLVAVRPIRTVSGPFHRQLHADPPCRKPRPLLLVHIHAWVVAFYESCVYSLRMQVFCHLLDSM